MTQITKHISEGEKFKKHLSATVAFGKVSDLTISIEDKENGHITEHSVLERLRTLKHAKITNEDAAGKTRAFLSGKSAGWLDKIYSKTKFNQATQYLATVSGIAQMAQTERSEIHSAMNELKYEAQQSIGADIVSAMVND